MKRKIIILSMLFATTFFALPMESRASATSNASATQPGRGGRGGQSRWEQSRWEHSRWERSRRGRGRHRGWKNSYGYRNYGQYRRTQVGNRRYRMVRRYYWRDGIRLSRLVRYYY